MGAWEISFNLVIERLLISSKSRDEAIEFFAVYILFQSRNREASNFKSKICAKTPSSADKKFQSRNREASNFKSVRTSDFNRRTIVSIS